MYPLLRLREGTPMLERRTIGRQCLLSLFERGEHYLIKRRQCSGLRSFGLTRPRTWPRLVGKRPADRWTDTPHETGVRRELWHLTRRATIETDQVDARIELSGRHSAFSRCRRG